MARLGADDAQLDELARQFGRTSRYLGGVGTRTTALLGETWWDGPDAVRTRSWWNDEAARQLRDAAGWLDRLGDELRREADGQRAASEAGAPVAPPAADPTSWVDEGGRWMAARVDDFVWGATKFSDGINWLAEVMATDTGDSDDDDDGGFSLKGAVVGTVDKVSDVGGAVIDRGTTVAEYGVDTGWRRVTNPVQTVVDVATFTTYAEDLAALGAIVVEDAEIVDDHTYEGDAIVLEGASVPDGADAMTIGHTIRAPGEVSEHLLDHEMQHVYDVEDVGGLPFYASYGVDYLWNRVAEGRDHDSAYEDIFWERRAYGLDPDDDPEGIYGGIWKGGWFR